MQYCPVVAGLCQGCPLSLTLYITYMDRFSRDSKKAALSSQFGGLCITSLLCVEDEACWLQQMLIS